MSRRYVNKCGLSNFQAKAVAIIEGIHGRDDAGELAGKYRLDNAMKMCSELWGERWGRAIKAAYDADPKAFPCVASVSEGGGVDFTSRDARPKTDRIASDDVDELCRRARTALEDEDLDAVIEYHVSEIVPIPAKCPRCKKNFLGAEAISAPSLDNACCFYCGPSRSVRLVLHPKHKGFIDAKTARLRAGGERKPLVHNAVGAKQAPPVPQLDLWCPTRIAAPENTILSFPKESGVES